MYISASRIHLNYTGYLQLNTWTPFIKYLLSISRLINNSSFSLMTIKMDEIIEPMEWTCIDDANDDITEYIDSDDVSNLMDLEKITNWIKLIAASDMDGLADVENFTDWINLNKLDKDELNDEIEMGSVGSSDNDFSGLRDLINLIDITDFSILTDSIDHLDFTRICNYATR